MSKINIFNIADEYNTTSDRVIEAFDAAHEKLINDAHERGEEGSVIFEDDELSLEGDFSEWFSDNAQTLFDEYLVEELEKLNP